MCEKIISKGSSRNIDSCLIDELKEIESTTFFKNTFKSVMSCCGHNKYKKTFIVRNKYSGCYFDWFSGIILNGLNNSRNLLRKPFYKRDKEGYYYIPEIVLS